MRSQVANERRTHARTMTAALADIIDEHGVASTCVLEDISQSGVLCHAGIDLAVGSVVQLKVGAIQLRALVKHCGISEYGFYFGLQFIGESWPSPAALPLQPMAERR